MHWSLRNLLTLLVFIDAYQSNNARPTQENAFDKIARIDSKYKESTDWKYEVDMILPEVKETRKRRSAPRGMLGSIKFNTVKLWPNGVVPYTISSELVQKEGFMDVLMDAMYEWQNKTCIKFKKRTFEKHFVHIYLGDGCLSDVGVKSIGRQTVSIGHNCDDRKIIIHELGHTIGLFHEQNRPDRDHYIKVLYNNIIPAYHYAYQIKSGWHPESIKTKYDYYSVMHYGNKDFSIGDRVTMHAYRSGVSAFGGIQVSGLDAIRVRRMYKCKEYPRFPQNFYWSHNNYGTRGKTCIAVTEPRDAKNSWNNNKLCYFGQGKRPLDIKWSSQGPIPGMSCTKVSYYRKSKNPAWNDNYICISKYGPFKFRWVNGRVPRNERRKNCLRINEPYDRDWRKDYHYLCAYQRETDRIDGKWSDWSRWGECSRKCGGGMQFRQRKCSPTANGGKSCEGEKVESKTCNVRQCDAQPSFPEDFKYIHTKPFRLPTSGICLRTYDMYQYWLWADYYFCTSEAKSNPNIEWSYMGPIKGMRCTKIYNPRERHGWKNNYLCVPQSSPYRFKWSIKGPIPGMECLRWYAQQGQRGWSKTYLCDDKRIQPIKAFH
ncbi:uncharacterized protein LOC110231216 [Exaiptasia diaphana]|uniref:Metalloendopeptidase n=1 Tax=Exaiptasia diaphana TaxID=2652724 RepID=A0A913WNX4_EXADI|nr:uncharacterized protein LOC110231216 [Exaiptasia diaphana]KXJ19193.1 Tolloid-like protein 1 [Exaiptasia diaphana]